MRNKFQDAAIIVATIAPIIISLTMLAALATHIIVCLKTAAWGFLIAGALFFPIGIIHGFGIWAGAW